MKITFVLPGMFVAGGIRSVLEIASELVVLNHHVTVVCNDSDWQLIKPPKIRARRKIKDTLTALYYSVRDVPSIEPWIPTQARVLRIPNLSHRFIPSGDVVVATSWETAEWVATYPASKGRKFYFVQHYETWAGPHERVDGTYRLPLTKIVVAHWLKQLMEEKFDQRALGPVIMGVRSDQFFNKMPVLHNPRTIGFMVSGQDWKGTDDALEAVQNVSKEYSNIRLIVFGWTKEANVNWPVPSQFYLMPDQAKIRELYCASDIWVSPSWHEGGGPMPCQEASACSCAIVTTDVGAVREIYSDGESALISPPRQPSLLAGNVIRLLKDECYLRKMKENAQKNMKRFTWKRSAEQMLECFNSDEFC